jgi:hypothetical protein
LKTIDIGDQRCETEENMVDAQCSLANPLVNIHRSNFSLFMRNWGFGKLKETNTHKDLQSILDDSPRQKVYNCRWTKP